jgi:prophage antirepressor-like protein
MTDISLFSFDNSIVRTSIEAEGGVWFCARDIAEALEHSKAAVMLEIVEESESKNFLLPNSRGEMRETPFINESGLYRVLFRSNLPKAKPFQDWLARDVLPSIRKNGAYGAAPRPVTNNPQLAALRDLIDNLVALDVAQQQQKKEIQQLRSEVRELPSKISGCAGFYTILAYANIRKVRVDAKQGSVLGKAATMLCNKEGIKVGKVSDSRYGEINTYPEEILSKVWDMFF